LSPKLAIGHEINFTIFKFKKFFPEKTAIAYQFVHWRNIHMFNNNKLTSTQNLNKFVNDSLKSLRINSLYALLIHDPSDLKN